MKRLVIAIFGTAIALALVAELLDPREVTEGEWLGFLRAHSELLEQ